MIDINIWEKYRKFVYRFIENHNDETIFNESDLQEIRQGYEFSIVEWFRPNYSLRRFQNKESDPNNETNYFRSAVLLAYKFAKNMINKIPIYDIICYDLFEHTNNDALKKEYGNEILKYSSDENLKDIIIERLAIVSRRFRCLTHNKEHIALMNDNIVNAEVGREFFRYCYTPGIPYLSIDNVELIRQGNKSCLQLTFKGETETNPSVIDDYNNKNGIPIRHLPDTYYSVGRISYSIKIILKDLSELQMENPYNPAYIPMLFYENDVASWPFHYSPKICFLLYGAEGWGGQIIWCKAKSIEFKDGIFKHDYLDYTDE